MKAKPILKENFWLLFNPAYDELNIHQRINARQARNGLNICGLFTATMESVRLSGFREREFEQCPSNQWKLYHKRGKRHFMYKR